MEALVLLEPITRRAVTRHAFDQQIVVSSFDWVCAEWAGTVGTSCLVSHIKLVCACCACAISRSCVRVCMIRDINYKNRLGAGINSPIIKENKTMTFWWC